MLEPLSPRLTALLYEMRLCRPRDLRGCRTLVKRLSSDLPTFDSVWIDALVRRRVLTPFQAQLLESDRPEALAIGEFLAVDRLGKSRRSETWLARERRKPASRWALKRMQIRPEQHAAARARLDELCSRGATLTSRQLGLPRSVVNAGDETVVASQYLPGLNLRELMIRRGRFPVRIVVAIARQVLARLQRLADARLVHGDLRLDNIKLGPDGQTLLTETGIRAAVTPQLTFVAELSSEQCEAFAPELIATGREPDVQSDLYSLGCVLWNLLSGRPTVKDADPLAKLAAHQRRTIGDVREWAPDVPEWLASAIRSLTRRDPAERPASLVAAIAQFGRPTWGDRSELRRFQAHFSSQAPAWTIQARPARRFPWMTSAAVLLLVSGLAVSLLHDGARLHLLSLAHRVRDEAEQFLSPPEVANDKSTASVATELPFPPPNAEGVILLDQAGPYLAGELSTVGPLTIQAAAGVEPIIVGRAPLKITCESLTLDGIHFRSPTNADQSALVMVRSLDLTVRNCSFDLANSTEPRARRSIGIAWKSIDPQDRSGGAIRCENVCWRGGDAHLFFASPPAEWNISNCLSLDANAFCRMKEWADPARPLEAEFRQLGLRGTRSLIRFDEIPGDRIAGQILILAQQSVFDLPRDDSALFAFQQPQVTSSLLARLSLTGDGNVAPETVVLAGRRERAGDGTPGEMIPLDTSSMAIEGIVLAPLDYAGDAQDVPHGSRVLDFAGPKLGAEMPGIDPDALSFPAGNSSDGSSSAAPAR